MGNQKPVPVLVVCIWAVESVLFGVAIYIAVLLIST